MAFLEQRLSDDISRGSKGGPRGSRVKTYVQSGALKQQFNWSRPLHRWDISFGIKTMADFEEVRAFWMVVNFGTDGPYSGFRYKDWADYLVTRTTGTLLALGGGSYQLQRRYTRGVASFDRAITKPVSGTVVLYDAGGTPLTATIATTTGIATGVSGTPASWDGEFDVPVTFESDDMDTIDLVDVSDEGGGLLGLNSIILEELAAES